MVRPFLSLSIHPLTNIRTYKPVREEWGEAKNRGAATLISAFSLGFSKPHR